MKTKDTDLKSKLKRSKIKTQRDCLGNQQFTKNRNIWRSVIYPRFEIFKNHRKDNQAEERAAHQPNKSTIT